MKRLVLVIIAGYRVGGLESSTADASCGKGAAKRKGCLAQDIRSGEHGFLLKCATRRGKKRNILRDVRIVAFILYGIVR